MASSAVIAQTGRRAPDLRISPAARRGGLKAGERRIGWMFLIPALLAFVCVIAVPFVRALGMAFTRNDLRTPVPQFIGLRNFETILASPEIMGSFVTTAIYVICATVFTLVLGLIWALILNQPFRGRTALRAASLIPWVLPSTVTAFVWGWIFNSRYGVMNAALIELGLIDQQQAWLSNATGAMAAIVITKVWFSIPLFMSFFLAGLQGLDREQIDAARVDGAGNFAVLRDHILPHLRPVILVVVVLGLIGNLQHFDTIFALTGGGPVRSTAVLSIEVFRRAFDQWDIGLASAVGLLWVATILPAAYFYLRHLLKGV
jgi:multiple sugar transport system permease protein